MGDGGGRKRGSQQQAEENTEHDQAKENHTRSFILPPDTGPQSFERPDIRAHFHHPLDEKTGEQDANIQQIMSEKRLHIPHPFDRARRKYSGLAGSGSSMLDPFTLHTINRYLPDCLSYMPYELLHRFCYDCCCMTSMVLRRISTKSGLRLAPPTSAPSMSGRLTNSLMLAGVTLPP